LPESGREQYRLDSREGANQIRPEEVAASGMFDDLPASFAQLEPAGAWILAQIPAVA
jgi:hypothetical protein